MSDPQRYLVVFEHMEGSNYGAWVPDLPGVIAAAETREECEHLVREAIELHLAGMREDGEPIPGPSSVDATLVSISAAQQDRRRGGPGATGRSQSGDIRGLPLHRWREARGERPEPGPARSLPALSAQCPVASPAAKDVG